MTDTAVQYEGVRRECADIFIKKTRDYGTAWRVLRSISIVDQIYIKAQRIRTIQETGAQKIDDGIHDEFIGIINYSIIGLIQQKLKAEEDEELPVAEVEKLYKENFDAAFSLMERKNHDYGEAWRQMSQESLVDLILMKVHRMRQIIGNKGQTLISEGLDANFYDMINYAVFALIMMQEQNVKA